VDERTILKWIMEKQSLKMWTTLNELWACFMDLDYPAHGISLPFFTLKKKLSHYMPRWHLGGEEVQLLLILDLSTRWG
jgi:hypothetical protein